MRDLSVDYTDDDWLLVGNAAQVILEPLDTIVMALEAAGGDISLVAHQDGSPSGIMLVSCRALRLIPEAGFVDMKEQALPLIASKHEVRVILRRQATGLPVRSLRDYLSALREYHRRQAGKVASADPLAEDWESSFAIVEKGAQVGTGARVLDSVVLDGAKVEAGAVVVRSLVCPGGVAKSARTVVDELVSGARR